MNLIALCRHFVNDSWEAGMLTDPHDEVIVRSTIDLGHNLGLMVVAEGVESVPMLARLADFGCDVAQGFHFSPPLMGAELCDLLHRLTSQEPASSISS